MNKGKLKWQKGQNQIKRTSPSSSNLLKENQNQRIKKVHQNHKEKRSYQKGNQSKNPKLYQRRINFNKRKQVRWKPE